MFTENSATSSQSDALTAIRNRINKGREKSDSRFQTALESFTHSSAAPSLFVSEITDLQATVAPTLSSKAKTQADAALSGILAKLRIQVDDTKAVVLKPSPVSTLVHDDRLNHIG